jgi:NADH dehydrogenase
VILVTGGTGFVGRHVVHALRAEDRPVRCLVRSRSGPAHQLASWGCDLVQGDVTDPASVRQAIAGCDVVVHLVSIITGRPADFERVMTRATRDLVAAARDAGVRRIVLMSALGTSPETRDLVPYYRAKWEMEQAARESGLEYVVLRPSFVFGRDGGVLPLFVRQVRYLPATLVIGDGNRRLQPIWVEDLAAYTAAAVGRPEAANRVFELGGPDRVTWNELYARIKRILGVRRGTVHVPLGLAGANARLLELLPRPPLTRDQLKMLEAGDNVAHTTPALETFGLGVVTLDEQIRRAV